MRPPLFGWWRSVKSLIFASPNQKPHRNVARFSRLLIEVLERRDCPSGGLTLSNPGTQTNYDGDSPSVSLIGTDRLGNPMTFDAANLPAGVTLSYSATSNTQAAAILSGTIASDADSSGPYSITVTVTDTVTSQTKSQTYTWDIYPVPVPVATSATLSVEQGLEIPSISLSQYISGGNQNQMQGAVVDGPTHGQLSYNGDATYAYAAPSDWIGTDSFTFQGSDGAAQSNVATVSINVTQYAPPNADGSYTTLANKTLPNIDFAQNDSDANGDPTQITIVSGPSNGALTENSDGTYNYTPNSNYVGGDQVTISANGGSPVNVAINVTDYAPIAFPTAYNVNNNGTFTVSSGNGVLANCIDVPGNPFNAILVSGPADGSLALNPDGSFSYTPNPAFSGTDSFVYEANDGMEPSNPATVTLNVTADVPPSAGDTSFSVLHDQTLTVSSPGLLEYASDTDGAPLTVALASGPSDGTLTLNSDGTFAYTPNSGFVGTDSFTYEAYDGIYDSAPATVTISVTDTAPLAAASYFSTPAGQTLTVSAPSGVLANAFDLDGGAMTAQLVSSTANGSLALNSDGSFIYVPNAGFAGNDAFTYVVSDGIMASDPVTATITVAGDLPIANDGYYATGMNTPLTVSGSGVLANDPIVGGATLTAALNTGPSNGSLTFNADGSFTYTPDQDFTGTDSFTYFAEAGGIQSATPGTVRFVVPKVALSQPQAQWAQGPWVFLDAGDYNGSAWRASDSSMTVAGTVQNATTFQPAIRPGGGAISLLQGLIVTVRPGTPGIPANAIPPNTTILSVNANNTVTFSNNVNLPRNVSLQFTNPTSVNIPELRDYSSIEQYPNNRTDPLLLPVTVNLAIPAGMTGFVQVQVQSTSGGQIRLWSDQSKTMCLGGSGLYPRNYPLAGPGSLPSTIYVEGISRTSVPLNQQGQGNPAPDCTIIVSLMTTMPGQRPIRAASAQVSVGVSPVVTNYTIAAAQPYGFANGVDFSAGFTSRQPLLNGGAAEAATFSALVFDPNMPANSQAQFVQTITMQNTILTPANPLGPLNGFVFAANAGVAPQSWRWMVAGQALDGSTVMVDTAAGPGPFYLGPPGLGGGAQALNEPFYGVTYADSPRWSLPAGMVPFMGLRNAIVNQVGFVYNFTDYLTWQMPVLAGSGPLTPNPQDNRPATIVFTLATDTWNFSFQASALNPNAWANQQVRAIVVGNPALSSADPKITGPGANPSFNIG